MVVSWIPLTLSEARGFITSYIVFYSPQVSKRKRQEPNTMQKTVVSGDVNRTIIDGLDLNTAYDVQMSANTKAGASTLSPSALSEVFSAPVPFDTGKVTILSLAIENKVICDLTLLIFALFIIIIGDGDGLLIALIVVTVVALVVILVLILIIILLVFSMQRTVKYVIFCIKWYITVLV